MRTTAPVLVLVVCAAPPAKAIDQLAGLLTQNGWDVHSVLTEAAVEWVDESRLQLATGHPVRTRRRQLEEPKLTPKADLVVVAPATFNTINQWVSGINNTPALGVLNEALGARVPIVAAPFVKAALAGHPTFVQNLQFLRRNGVQLTDTDALRPDTPEEPYRWERVLELLPPAR